MVTNLNQIKNYFGRKRYFELRAEAFEEWKREGKDKGISVRYYVARFIGDRYIQDHKQIHESQINHRLNNVLDI